MRSLLVVSPPTLDYIYIRGSEVKRAGGPALYASFGASLLGYRVLALGPWGWETAESVTVERDVGVERVGYPFAGRGAVFRHYYVEGKRISEILGRPEAVRLDEFIGSVEDLKPDIVMISPVTGEEAGHVLAAAVPLTTVRCIALDVQGYVRGYNHLWYSFIARSRRLVIHASTDDLSEEDASLIADRGILVYTRGEGPVTLYDGTAKIEYSGPRRRVTDPTGAGDIFTAIFSSTYCETLDAESSLRAAVELTPKALEAAREALG